MPVESSGLRVKKKRVSLDCIAKQTDDPELQIGGGIEDNLKIIFLIPQ